jgi:hypothetical protein
MGVGSQRHAPADLPPGETLYPFDRRLGGPQGRSERVWKISPPPGFDPRVVRDNYRVKRYFHVKRYGGCFLQVKGPRRETARSTHLLPSLRINGATPPPA